MLMTAMKPPTEVTPHGEKLLEALRSAGGQWMNRRAIANAIGKRRLTPYDLALLELLVNEGIIEAEKHPSKAPIPFEWEYRATE
jgi:hypothetical protein